MRFLLSITSFILCTMAAKGQVDVSIHLHQKLGDRVFTYDTVTETPDAYFIRATWLAYYLSEVKLIHDGGVVTPVTDQYFLVSPATDSILPLGSFNITSLEGIEFSLGVDSAHNHLDPASFPSSHPLAPKNPSMHWGWAAGYRFVAFEGFAGYTSGQVNNSFQIHTIGDVNYKTVSLSTNGHWDGGSLSIPITADYMQLLNTISVVNGMISHSTSGNARKMIENMQASVFTADETTAVADVEPAIDFTLSPNPSNGTFSLDYDLSQFDAPEIIITDMNGRLLSRRIIPSMADGYRLQADVPNGTYAISVVTDGKVIATRQFIVQF